MKLTKYLLLSMLILGIAFIGCTDEADDNQNTDGDTENGSENESDITADGDFDNTTSSSFKLEFFKGGENKTLEKNSEYKILGYWTSQEEETTGFTVTSDEDQAANARLKANKSIKNIKPIGMTELKYKKLLRKFEWDKKMRAKEAMYIENGLITEDDFKSSPIRGKKSSECGEKELARGDECKPSFDLVYTDFNGTESTITVNVRGKGKFASVVVHSDDDSKVSDDDVSKIIEKFDNVIYYRNHALFGTTTFDKIDYTDRDQDGLKMIVLTSLVEKDDAVGMFNPGDFMTKDNGGSGNLTDLLWVTIPSTENPLESAYATVAHEYFHMMIFAVKGIKFKSAETLYLNESLAHTAEDASGFGIDNIDIVDSYLQNTADYSWAFSGDSIEARAAGFMFLRYLFEQKGGVDYSGNTIKDNGGAAFLTSLLSTSKKGFEAVDEALGSSWKESFRDWGVAVTVSGLGLTTDSKYNYKPLYKDTASGQDIGICTNCTRTNTSGTDIELAGFEAPEVSDSYDASIMATGVSCASISTQDNTTKLDVSLEDDSYDVQFALIKVK